MKALGPLVTTLLLVSTTFAQEAEGPFSRYADAVVLTMPKYVTPTFKLPDGDSVDNNRVTRYLKDTLNVEMQYPLVMNSPEQAEQRINLTIASGDLPDAMTVNASQFRELAEAGLLEDLSPYYDTYASPELKSANDATEGESLAAATVDGQLLGISKITLDGDGLQFLWIRQDWLNALGLEKPQTLEELETVARAFVTDDPDGNGQADTIGLSASQNWSGSFLPIFGAFTAFPGRWVEGADGEAVYGTAEPQVKEALATLQRWYQEGLIDPEFATINGDIQQQKLSAGKVGIVSGAWWAADYPLKFTRENVPDANWVPVLAPITSDNTFPAFYQGITGSQFVVVRKGYEHPEVVFKILNLQGDFGTRQDLATTAEGLPLEYQDVPEFNVIWSDVWPTQVMQSPDLLTRRGQAIQAALESNDPSRLPQFDVRIYESIKRLHSEQDMTPGDWGGAQAWDVGVPTTYDKRIVPHREVYQAAGVIAQDRIWPTLVKREDETMLRILTGQLPVDDFDRWAAEWQGLGGEDITQTVRETVAAQAEQQASQ